MIGIYKLTSPNGKIYIGQSIHIKKRFKQYLNYKNCKNQTKLYNSLKKHGSENFKYEILELCNLKILQERERYWQIKYECLTEKGLNLCLSSTQNTKLKFSKETLKKFKDNGKKTFLGKKHTKETRKKISDSKKGKKLSASTRLKLSIYHRNTPLTKKQLEAVQRWKNSRKKLCLNTETGIYYLGIKEAAEAYNINRSTLTSYLNGQKKNKSSFINV